jgi:hypothetical protein
MAPAGGSDRHDWELAERRRVRVTLSSWRDRLTAIGRRRSDLAKTELYWGARRWRQSTKNFRFGIGERESQREALVEAGCCQHRPHSSGADRAMPIVSTTIAATADRTAPCSPSKLTTPARASRA